MGNTLLLSQVCKIVSGNSVPVKEKEELFTGVEGMPYVATKDVGFDGSINYKNGISIPNDYLSKFRVSPAGATLVCAEGGSAGRKIAFSYQDCCYVNKLFSIQPKETMAPRFIYYYILSNEFQSQFKKAIHGLIGGVSLSKIKDFSITTPSLAEQQRIVTKLDAAFAEIDKTIEITNYKISNYNELSSGIMREVLNNNFYRWETKTLSQLSENLDTKRVPITKSKRVSGSVPYYGASGIVDYVEGYLFDDNILLISEDGANLLMRTYPIAFSVSGKCWVNNHAHVLKFKNPKLQEWVELYLNATNLSPYISGMAQPKLNQKKLNEIPIPCPNLEMLDKLLKIVMNAKTNLEKIFLIEEKKMNELKSLKSSILAQELQSKVA